MMELIDNGHGGWKIPFIDTNLYCDGGKDGLIMAMADSPCNGCPYSRGHQFCFPCMRDIKNNDGVKAWAKKYGVTIRTEKN